MCKFCKKETKVFVEDDSEAVKQLSKERSKTYFTDISELRAFCSICGDKVTDLKEGNNV